MQRQQIDRESKTRCSGLTGITVCITNAVYTDESHVKSRTGSKSCTNTVLNIVSSSANFNAQHQSALRSLGLAVNYSRFRHHSCGTIRRT